MQSELTARCDKISIRKCKPMYQTVRARRIKRCITCIHSYRGAAHKSTRGIKCTITILHAPRVLYLSVIYRLYSILTPLSPITRTACTFHTVIQFTHAITWNSLSFHELFTLLGETIGICHCELFKMIPYSTKRTFALSSDKAHGVENLSDLISCRT